LVEHGPAKFGQLIEKQHSVVGQGQLSWSGLATSTDQPRPGAAVVGAAKGAGLQQALAAVQQARHRVDGCELKGLRRIERR
jgi:hypothetical protein